MNYDKVHALKQKFPQMFANVPAGYISCNDGWYAIIDCLCSTMQGHIDSHQRTHDWIVSRGEESSDSLVAPVYIQQIKEKFGTMRFYFIGGDDYIAGAVHLAECLSSLICEDCGAPGKTRAGSWIRTLCDTCSIKDS
jgi:hypothetical protein